MGSFGNLTVTNVITEHNGNVVVRDTARRTSITSLGTLSAVTVTGYAIPSNTNGSNNITAVTVPGLIAGVPGTITGGTFVSNATITSAGTLTRPGYAYSQALAGNDTPSKFTAVVGDGKLLKIEVKCQNCTVDFK